ncbi:hypothetical protein [Psychrobacillus vulpis]|uniref:Uncharacterized protein n=1 Tax=Psychrobacillus vulpis TaxID=2325572 RepID=A0A544TP94_9BACI|nr:hypothetical protein [Psychrobacillus vulpis]TQR19281.1 hypothetical protein FG384_13805 [Psychrobacillus vulpis]
MEGLIILIISLIVSALFGQKKKAAQKPVKDVQQEKPFKENPFKGLEDFAKEFKVEHKKMDRKPPEVQKTPTLVEKVEREVPRDRGVPRSSGRLSIHQDKVQNKNVSKPIDTNILPSSKEELVRAIVFSEILAPPKSKR